jgi:hypothetical protein
MHTPCWKRNIRLHFRVFYGSLRISDLLMETIYSLPIPKSKLNGEYSTLMVNPQKTSSLSKMSTPIALAYTIVKGPEKYTCIKHKNFAENKIEPIVK